MELIDISAFVYFYRVSPRFQKPNELIFLLPPVEYRLGPKIMVANSKIVKALL